MSSRPPREPSTRIASPWPTSITDDARDAARTADDDGAGDDDAGRQQRGWPRARRATTARSPVARPNATSTAGTGDDARKGPRDRRMTDDHDRDHRRDDHGPRHRSREGHARERDRGGRVDDRDHQPRARPSRGPRGWPRPVAGRRRGPAPPPSIATRPAAIAGCDERDDDEVDHRRQDRESAERDQDHGERRDLGCQRDAEALGEPAREAAPAEALDRVRGRASPRRSARRSRAPRAGTPHRRRGRGPPPGGSSRPSRAQRPLARHDPTRGRGARPRPSAPARTTDADAPANTTYATIAAMVTTERRRRPIRPRPPRPPRRRSRCSSRRSRRRDSRRPS